MRFLYLRENLWSWDAYRVSTWGVSSFWANNWLASISPGLGAICLVSGMRHARSKTCFMGLSSIGSETFFTQTFSCSQWKSLLMRIYMEMCLSWSIVLKLWYVSYRPEVCSPVYLFYDLEMKINEMIKSKIFWKSFNNRKFSKKELYFWGQNTFLWYDQNQ